MTEHSAITVKAQGYLREIIMNVDVQLAKSLASLFKIAEKRVQIRALWDTGASTTAVSSRLAGLLALPPTGMTKIQGAGGVHDSRMFKIDLFFPNTKVVITDIESTEFATNGVFDLIIGMDIITLGDMSVTNANKHTMFSYRIPPDAFHVDYVDMTKKARASREALRRFNKKQRKK